MRIFADTADEVRQILVIVVDRTMTVMTARWPVSGSVGKVVRAVAGISNMSAVNERRTATKASKRAIAQRRRLKTASSRQKELSENDYEYYEWSRLRFLPAYTPINQIPRPGVIIAVRKPSKPREGSTDSTAWGVRQLLDRDKGIGGQRLKRFLASAESDFEPLPLREHDVFLSYDTDDESLADEIAHALSARGLKCYQATGQIRAGQLWKDELRQALRRTGVLVLLLTRRSINSQWVMCEIGACWALGIPIVPATVSVPLTAVPEIVSAHQCRPIETAANRSGLADDIFRLCRGFDAPDAF